MPRASKANVTKSSSPEIHLIHGDLSLTRQAYDRLQEMIITLELKPGMLISESQISEMLSLGRSPVREAVQRLQREGLLDVHRARGIMVAPINVVRQLHLLDVRRPLEQLLAARATRHASEEQRAAMLDIAKRFYQAAETNSGIEFIRTLRAAYRIKVQSTRNEILENVMDLFSGLSIRFWYAHYREQPNCLHEAGDIHARILQAISVTDEVSACKISDELIDYLDAFTRRTIV